jgi:hypothetical protein
MTTGCNLRPRSEKDWVPALSRGSLGGQSKLHCKYAVGYDVLGSPRFRSATAKDVYLLCTRAVDCNSGTAAM